MATFQFRLGWFLIAFAAGVLYVYISHPRPTIVYKYPTPYNSGKVVYADAAGNCYKFKVKTLESCPEADDKVVPQPIV
jgi:subtilisin family serine protease